MFMLATCTRRYSRYGLTLLPNQRWLLSEMYYYKCIKYKHLMLHLLWQQSLCHPSKATQTWGQRRIKYRKRVTKLSIFDGLKSSFPLIYTITNHNGPLTVMHLIGFELAISMLESSVAIRLIAHSLNISQFNSERTRAHTSRA